MEPDIDYNSRGNTLCDALIDQLISARRTNRSRLEAEVRKPNGHISDRYSAICRQLTIINQLIKIGRMPFTPERLYECLKLGYLSGELYPIGD